MGRIGRPPHPDILTPREWEVLSLLRQALTNGQIGERLGVSANAAKYHVSEILSKLGVNSRWEAAAWRPQAKPWWAAGIAVLGWPLRRLSLPVAAKAAGVAVVGATLVGVGVLVWSVVETSGPRDELVTGPHLQTEPPAPHTSSTPTATPPLRPEPEPAFVAYTVQPGDTVAAIAASFGIDQKYILWNNPDVVSADPDFLKVGEKLAIPSVNGIIYNVKLGDKLSDIASVYQIDVSDIRAFAPNKIGSGTDSVPEGTVLVLPGAVPPPTPAPPAEGQ